MNINMEMCFEIYDGEETQTGDLWYPMQNRPLFQLPLFKCSLYIMDLSCFTTQCPESVPILHSLPLPVSPLILWSCCPLFVAPLWHSSQEIIIIIIIMIITTLTQVLLPFLLLLLLAVADPKVKMFHDLAPHLVIMSLSQIGSRHEL